MPAQHDPLLLVVYKRINDSPIMEISASNVFAFLAAYQPPAQSRTPATFYTYRHPSASPLGTLWGSGILVPQETFLCYPPMSPKYTCPVE